MWLCVFFVASLLDLDLTIAGDDTVARISQVNIGVLALIYGYVGSIGAEAFIRYWDEISWNKFPLLGRNKLEQVSSTEPDVYRWQKI